MITLLSPAKTLDYESPLPVKDFSVPGNLRQSKQLIKALRKKDPQDLSDLMGLSERLANLNFERNMNWEPPVKHSDDIRQAIFAFKGDVYTGLSAYSLKKSDIIFLDKHVRILSGLYGILKPLDLMSPYRLEMGTKFENAKGKNLYDFWSNEVTNNLNKNIKKHENKTIINCSSNEYFNVIDQKNLEGDILNTVFKEYRDGELKFISFNAKKARGLLAKFVINNKIKSINDLKDFNLENYKFDSSLSDDLTFVFTR